jgi:hypothetical protein
MSTPETVRVTVEIARSSDTITGQIAVEGASATSFFGWLDLIDRLERAAGLRGSEQSPEDSV